MNNTHILKLQREIDISKEMSSQGVWVTRKFFEVAKKFLSLS